MWAQLPNRYGANVFRFNTVQLPILANTIAVYGGTKIQSIKKYKKKKTKKSLQEQIIQ